jgi:4-amino-4-deoxy-L-arabinose transferase-like glycosyltransferase
MTNTASLLDRIAHSRWAYALLALAVLACALPGVFSIPVLDRDEARFAQATKQMLETGDFVNIFVQDEPRNKKPIGIHWAQGLTAGLTTHTEIWGYRLASVLGTLISAFALLWGGTALVGRTAAFAGAVLFAMGILASTEAMIAKTDAMLCGFTALAMAALAQLYVGKGSRAAALVFWAALGAGILIKGPITPMVAGLALLALFLWERKAAWMRPLRHWSGPMLAAVIVAPWMIAIGIATKGAFFAEAIGGDLGPKVAGGHEGHAGLPGMHLLLAPLLLFPATFALIPALQIGWRTARAGGTSEDPQHLRFLLAWAVPTWLVFELLPTKLVHYTLPAYPAVALLCGVALVGLAAWGRWTKRASLLLLLLMGTAMVLLAGYLSTFMPGLAPQDERRAFQAAAAGGIALLALAIGLARTRSAALALLLLAITGAATSYTIRERLLPEASELLVSAEAARALARENLRPAKGRALLIVDFRETSLVFQTCTDARLLNGEEAGMAAQAGDVAIFNMRGATAAAFTAGLTRRGLAFEPAGPPVLGLNYSNGDDVSLAPGRIVTTRPPESTPSTSD